MAEREREEGEDSKEVSTGNTDIVTEHESSGGGHYAGNDDNRRDLGLELGASAWRNRESSRWHDCSACISQAFLDI